MDYLKANPPDLAVLTCDAKSLPGLRGATESTLLALFVLRLGPLKLPSLMTHLVVDTVSADHGVLIHAAALITVKEESYQEATLYGDICRENRFYDYRYAYNYNYQDTVLSVKTKNFQVLV